MANSTVRSPKPKRPDIFISFRKWWATNKSPIYSSTKKLFHFKKIGNWIIALCWGVGFTVAIGAVSSPSPVWLFYLAYLLFFFGLVWSLGSFLTSDFLNKKNPHSWSNKRRKNHDVAKQALRNYRISAFVSSVAIFGLFCFSWFVTYKIQEARGLLEFADVDKNLKVTVYPSEAKNLLDSVMSVVNDSDQDIKISEVSCGLNGLKNYAGGGVIGGQFWIHSRADIPLSKNTPWSKTCFAPMINTYGTPVCADVSVSLTYFLLSKPGAIKTKLVRFAGRNESGKLTWYGEPPNSNGRDYCH